MTLINSTTIKPHMDLIGSHTSNFSICRYKGNKVSFSYSGLHSIRFNQLDLGLCQRLRVGVQTLGKNRAFSSSPTRLTVSNRYGVREGNTSEVYRRLGSCLIKHPPKGTKPRAIIKFLGGAFVGAVPEVTYSHLIDLLAKEGYLIISVPYNVTFDHSEAARAVFERFNACLDMILKLGLSDANLTSEELSKVPLYSVGHSNGALLQLLIGSYFSEKIPKANVIISFNNKPAADAVPYFEQFGPLVNQMVPLVEASPIYPMAKSASGDVWKTLLDTAGAIIKEYDEEAVASLNNFVDQLPKVMNQVTEGVSEFKPTPAENRNCFENSYTVPHTLLVKFDSDIIDETDIVEEILKPRVQSIGGTLEKVILSGNHLTPCIQDLKWQVGYAYTPVDALAQGLKALSLNDTRVLARTVIDWLKSFDHQ